jgi:hypothetical protein
LDPIKGVIRKNVTDKNNGRTQGCDSDIMQGGWDYLKDKLKYPKAYEYLNRVKDAAFAEQKGT